MIKKTENEQEISKIVDWYNADLPRWEFFDKIDAMITDIKTVSRVELPVMQKARLYIKAKIQLLGMDKPKEVPITNISFKDEELFSVTVKYPLGNNHYDYLTYYFDGRKLGEEKDIDVSEIFKGFSA